MALIAEDEEKMKGMVRALEKYMERKRLKVNVEMTKIMRCKKGEEK